MGSLSDLYQQRRELDALIKETEEAAVKAGEYVVIDGERIDSTLNVEGELPTPKKTSYLLTYEKKNGDITEAGEISYEDLEANFLQSATEKVNEAVDAGNTAVQNINTAKADALAAIDNHVTNTSKPAINDYVNNTSKPAIDTYVANTSKPSLDTYTGEKKSELDGYVTSTNKPALDAYTDTKKGEISTLTTTSLQSLQTSLTDALNAIGETDDEGARKAALDAISAALTDALNSIGLSDSAGARGDAISAIATALQNALASIGQSDTAGARGEAITAIQNALTTALSSWQSQVTSDNAALDQKISGANSTIDQKVSAASTSASDAATSAGTASTKASEASTSASEAAGSASLAEKWASNPEDAVVAEGEYSAKHYAAKAAASASAASGSASAAATSASQASTSAGEAASSASQAASSASAADSAKTAAESARDEAQSIVGTALTPDRALVSDANGKFSASGVTATELAYLSGVTSSIQGQIDNKLIKSAQIFLTGAVTGDGAFADGSMTIELELGQALQEMLNEFNLYKLRGGLPVGVVVPWFNPDHTPERTLIANGAVISETHEAWPTLAAAWGISSGAITLPDMTNTINGDGKGNYICFTEDDTVVGTRVADAIRNITGRLADTYPNTWNNTACAGPFFVDDNEFEGGTYSSLARNGQDRKTFFDLSRAIVTAPENRPNSIYALALIAY